MWRTENKGNARIACKIRLFGHLKRFKRIIKKAYIIYNEFLKFLIGDLDIKLIDYIICPILAADGSHLF